MAQSMLVSSPSGGEPGQPRRVSKLQRRQTKSSIGARFTKVRNSKRGLRSLTSVITRQDERRKRRQLNRRKFREFKVWCQKYISKPTAPEPRARQRDSQRAFSKSATLDRTVRKSLFHTFKRPRTEKKHNPGMKLRYGKPLKVATLNVRSLIGENAYLKKCLIVDIMSAYGYDLMLLQETNRNKNSVETIKGFEFFLAPM